MKTVKEMGYRCELDLRDEKIGYKIREAQLDKVPYMLILGQKEKDNETVSVRGLDQGDLGEMKLQDFIVSLQGE
jgi:threonyl-tRNA synthetase